MKPKIRVSICAFSTGYVLSAGEAAGMTAGRWIVCAILAIVTVLYIVWDK